MAQLTLTVPNNQIDRIKEALANRPNPPIDPATITVEDVRLFLITQLKEMVSTYETQIGLAVLKSAYNAQRSAYAPPVAPDIT